MIRFVLVARLGEQAPGLGDQRLVGGRAIEREPERKAAGPEQVLRRRHAPSNQLGHVTPVECREDIGAVVEVEHHALRQAQRPANHRQQQLRSTETLFGRGSGSTARAEPAAAPGRLEIFVDPCDDPRQTLLTRFRVITPDDQPMVGKRESLRPGRDSSRQLADRPRERKAGTDVGDVHDGPLEQLRDQSLRGTVADVGQAHRGYIVRMCDHPVRKERVQRRLHAGRRPVGQHAAGHESHHLGVGHRFRFTQPAEPGQFEPGETVGPDGAQIGAAPLHQQNVVGLQRSVPAAGLHQAGVLADPAGEVDERAEESREVGRGASSAE